jgi:hypothetical protein
VDLAFGRRRRVGVALLRLADERPEAAAYRGCREAYIMPQERQ